MAEILIDEAIKVVIPYLKWETQKGVQDYDSNGDKLLDLAEYVKAVFGEGAGEAEWTEGEQQFEKDRDLDHDGVLDLEEVRLWMLPEAYDEHQVRDCRGVTYIIQ